MKKPRHNVNTIAELLIQEFDKLETTAKRIEKMSNTPLTINTKSLEQLLQQERQIKIEHREEERLFLNEFKTLCKKKQSRPPNAITALILLCFLACIGYILYYRSIIKDYNLMESKANYYEQLYKKCSDK